MRITELNKSVECKHFMANNNQNVKIKSQVRNLFSLEIDNYPVLPVSVPVALGINVYSTISLP